MFDIFQTNIPLFVSSLVLVAMGCAALFLSLLLRQKSRGLNRFSKNLFANVFDRTFSVFEPNEQPRKIINSHTGLVVFIAIYGSWLVAMIAVFKTFEIGGILGCVTFLICAGLLMIDETEEINRNAGIFLRALKNGAGLGKGDLKVLLIIRSASSMLTRYHLILAILFFCVSSHNSVNCRCSPFGLCRNRCGRTGNKQCSSSGSDTCPYCHGGGIRNGSHGDSGRRQQDQKKNIWFSSLNTG